MDGGRGWTQVFPLGLSSGWACFQSASMEVTFGRISTKTSGGCEGISQPRRNACMWFPISLVCDVSSHLMRKCWPTTGPVLSMAMSCGGQREMNHRISPGCGINEAKSMRGSPPPVGEGVGRGQHLAFA